MIVIDSGLGFKLGIIINPHVKNYYLEQFLIPMLKN